MGKQQKQTDNAFFEEKVQLRIQSLPGQKDIRVLDCYSGNGLLWSEVKKRAKDKNILTLRIDQKEDRAGVYLKGDNLKFLQAADLSRYDIVDLDAYGSPFHQLETLFRRGYKGIVHVTFIQTMQGMLHKEMLHQLGYTDAMIDKVPSLFSKAGFSKLGEWLYLHGIKEVHIFQQSRKNYFWFEMQC